MLRQQNDRNMHHPTLDDEEVIGQPNRRFHIRSASSSSSWNPQPSELHHQMPNIGLSTFSSSMTSVTTTTNSSQRNHEINSTITLCVPSLLADWIETLLNVCFACWQLAWELTAIKIIPSKVVLHRISVMAIAWDRVLEDLVYYWQTRNCSNKTSNCFQWDIDISTNTTRYVYNNFNMITMAISESNMNFAIFSFMDFNWFVLPRLLVHLSWLLPVLLLIFVLWISTHPATETTTVHWYRPSSSRTFTTNSTIYHRNDHNPSEPAMVGAALVLLLFCLEALCPVTTLGVTSLVLIHRVSHLTSFAILGAIYALSMILSRSVRYILYSRIGGTD